MYKGNLIPETTCTPGMVDSYRGLYPDLCYGKCFRTTGVICLWIVLTTF